METFKKIKEYPLYSISTRGTVKKNSDGKFLKASKTPNGYMVINLFTGDGRRKKELIHRLVAITFIPNPNHLPEVNHIDLNRANNDVSNLEWVTRYDNVQKSSICKPIAVKKDGQVIGTYGSIQAACNDLGLTNENVSAYLSGKYKHHKGYTYELLK